MHRRRRVLVYGAVALLAVAALGAQALTAAPPAPAAGEGAYPGETLVTVQAIGWFGNDNGKALVVDREGSIVWEYDPPNSRVFDGEQLANGRFLFSVATTHSGADCPDRYGDTCVRNQVVEVARENGSVVWQYAWWDAFPDYHEVHDADRLPNGETAIIDMGNDRAFTVNREGEVTWTWRADDYLREGSPLWEEHVPADQEERLRKSGPESDWTHMNDVDRLANGNLQLSIRNYDVVIEVDPATNEIVDVIGTPGDHALMKEQHNPMRIRAPAAAGGDTLLVADSENDRVVEFDVETEEIVWAYDGAGSGQRLRWPRDADRLPNGNTLVTDSRNFRVLEVGPNGSVVWQYSMAGQRGIVYEADRLSVPEESADVPTGRGFESRSYGGGAVGDTLATVESWMRFVFPYWMGVPELVMALVGLGALLGLGWEGWHLRRS